MACSVLEHAVWNFVFTGISRTCTHELIRHRAGFGYSQLSQRYVDESVAEVAGWITPVPGGVGLMTVACLLSNTLTAAKSTLR